MTNDDSNLLLYVYVCLEPEIISIICHVTSWCNKAIYRMGEPSLVRMWNMGQEILMSFDEYTFSYELTYYTHIHKHYVIVFQTMTSTLAS